MWVSRRSLVSNSLLPFSQSPHTHTQDSASVCVGARVSLSNQHHDDTSPLSPLVWLAMATRGRERSVQTGPGMHAWSSCRSHSHANSLVVLSGMFPDPDISATMVAAARWEGYIVPLCEEMCPQEEAASRRASNRLQVWTGGRCRMSEWRSLFFFSPPFF